MTFREDVRVVDATIRDGGLCNNFYFTDEFVRDLYKANQEAGVDYMEFGYKASADLFSPEEFGKWKFCHDEDIYDVVGDNDTDLKIAVTSDAPIISAISSSAATARLISSVLRPISTPCRLPSR